MRVFVIEKNNNLTLFYKMLFKESAAFYSLESWDNSWYILEDFAPTHIIIDDHTLQSGLTDLLSELLQRELLNQAKIYITVEKSSFLNSNLAIGVTILKKPLDLLQLRELFLGPL